MCFSVVKSWTQEAWPMLRILENSDSGVGGLWWILSATLQFERSASINKVQPGTIRTYVWIYLCIPGFLTSSNALTRGVGPALGYSKIPTIFGQITRGPSPENRVINLSLSYLTQIWMLYRPAFGLNGFLQVVVPIVKQIRLLTEPPKAAKVVGGLLRAHATDTFFIRARVSVVFSQ